MLDPERSGELGRHLIDRGRAANDQHAQAHGEWHAAFHLIRAAPLEQAIEAVSAARQRCLELGASSVVWLCDDLLGFIEIRRGDFDAAIDIGRVNEVIPADQRMPREQAITLLMMHTAFHQSLRFDAALRYGYKHLAIAETVGDIGQKAMALNNLSAVHLNAFNVEDALPLQREANAIWTRERTKARLGLSVNNLIAICDSLGLHEQAYEALQRWLNQAGGVSDEDLHHYNSRIALALLGVDRDDEAERHLASGPYPSPVNPRTVVWWTWTQARLLNRRGRYEEARTICQSYLDTRVTRPIADAPYDIVQLYDAIRIASEALGDSSRAHTAARLAHAACVPLVGSSVRARYMTMLLQQEPELEPEPGNVHGRRLQTLSRGVSEYGQALAREAESIGLSAGVEVLEPDPATGAAPAALLQQPFLAHVSHEMRAPLNGMLGMTSLLLLSDLDERQRRLAKLAKNSADILLRLVNDILDLGRMESGQFLLDPQAFALEPLLTETVDMFRPEAERKSIGLSLRLDAPLPHTVFGDAIRVRQVLGNLIGNAIKFTSQGEVALSVAPAGDKAVRFEVRDTGKGISVEAQSRLFNDFVQEDASIAREYGGTGLGLAICRRLVRLMHGEIGVRSEPGLGSTFWFEVELPASP